VSYRHQILDGRDYLRTITYKHIFHFLRAVRIFIQAVVPLPFDTLMDGRTAPRWPVDAEIGGVWVHVGILYVAVEDSKSFLVEP